MRDLPLVPYESLIELIDGNFTSKQMDYYFHLCKICNKDGVIKDKSINALIENSLQRDSYLLSRASVYRAVQGFVDKNIVFYNNASELEITNYKKSFAKGSKGLVVMPMFTFSMGFRRLSKLQKRVGLYIIAHIRSLSSEKAYTFNIKKMCKSFSIRVDAFHSTLDALSRFFDIALFHKGSVCRACYKKEYLLSVDTVKSLGNYYDDKAGEDGVAFIKELIYKLKIDKLLSDRRKNLYLEDVNRYLTSDARLSLSYNIDLIVKMLVSLSRVRARDVLDSLASKLRQFSDPIMNLGGYIRVLIEEDNF